jgi:hypothetical protein
MHHPNPPALRSTLVDLGMPSRDIARLYQTFNAASPEFAEAARQEERA